MLQQVVHNSRLHVPIIFTLGLLIFFPLLGARDFWGHENEYAEITRIMWLDGNYMLPMLNGELWAERPIFAFWIALPISCMNRRSVFSPKRFRLNRSLRRAVGNITE